MSEGLSGWQKYKFSDVLIDESISYGIVQPGAHSEIDSVPVVRVNNIKNGQIIIADVLKVTKEIEEKYQRTRLEGGELLITVVGSIGECAIVPDSLKGWNVARAISVARIKNNFDKRFIKYCFKLEDLKFQMYGKTNDTVQPTLNLSLLKELVLLIPSLPEQQAIAAVLSSLDDKIDLLHRQNKTLESMAETLFRQWFIEEVQEDWKVGELNDLIDVLSGFPFKSTSFNESGNFQLITIKAVQDGYLDLSNADRLNEIPSNMPDYCDLRNGDILLSLTGNVGRCCLVDSDHLLLNQRVAKIQPKQNRDWAFAYVFFRQLSMKRTLEELAKGTAQANLSPVETSKIAFVIPVESALQKYNDIATPLIKKTLRNKIQIKRIEKLRDTLLPKLMSGEVRVAV